MKKSANPASSALTAPLQLPLAAGPDLSAWSRQARGISLTLLVFLGGWLLWSFIAPLSGAIVSSGVIKTELNRKTIQHQEGGIVKAILVREGETVKAGQPLIEIGDVRTDATNSILLDRLASEQIRRARVQAELVLAADFAVPKVSGDVKRTAEYAARERAIFVAQRRTLDQQIAVLEAQIHETERQIKALEAQSAATEQSLKLSREELEINRNLVKEGFIQRTRILVLERTVTDYASNLGEFQGNLAQARQRIDDYRLRIVQTRNQYQQQAAADLKEAVARIDEAEEQLRSSLDQVERQVVRAPVDGVVMSLRVGAPGMAIGPREPILDVVPLKEKLVVEARIDPNDIDHVRIGDTAEVRLSAYEYRKTPLLLGHVATVSADRITDQQTGQSWYSVLIDVDVGKLAGHPDIQMQTGMTAEVFVTTPARTLFEYMMRPLTNYANRGMREP